MNKLTDLEILKKMAINLSISIINSEKNRSLHPWVGSAINELPVDSKTQVTPLILAILWRAYGISTEEIKRFEVAASHASHASEEINRITRILSAANIASISNNAGTLQRKWAGEAEAQGDMTLEEYHDHCKLCVEKPVEHGAYRQFIKRDKRKNFKLRK